MIARQDGALISNMFTCLTRKPLLSLNIYRLLLHTYLKAHFYPGGTETIGNLLEDRLHAKLHMQFGNDVALQ